MKTGLRSRIHQLWRSVQSSWYVLGRKFPQKVLQPCNRSWELLQRRSQPCTSKHVILSTALACCQVRHPAAVPRTSFPRSSLPAVCLATPLFDENIAASTVFLTSLRAYRRATRNERRAAATCSCSGERHTPAAAQATAYRARTSRSLSQFGVGSSCHPTRASA